MNRKTKRLTVKRETLRSLGKEELQNIAGATAYTLDEESCPWTRPHSLCQCASQVICSKTGSCGNDCW
jgi:hypothetical protein